MEAASGDMTRPMTQAFMDLAHPEVRPRFDALLQHGAASWAAMQQAFLRMID